VPAAVTPADPPARLPYPPDPHVLRDLQVTGTHRDGRRWSEIPVVPAILDHDGAPTTGVLGILVDIAAGSTSITAAIPDWCATASLDLRLQRLPADHGRLRAEARVLRKGSTTVVLEVVVTDARSTDGGAGPCAWSSLIFSIMPRRSGNLTVRDEEGEFAMGLAHSGFATTFAAGVGLDVVDAAAGHVTLPITDAARNSFGALQGGLQAVVADAAAAALGSHLLDRPVRTTDLAITYLAQGKVGPVTTRAVPLRVDDAAALVRVEVTDEGTGRLMSIVTATTAPSPASFPSVPPAELATPSSAEPPGAPT
jgi:acyl-coenzyme A thioesterase PaaI-like protein